MISLLRGHPNFQLFDQPLDVKNPLTMTVMKELDFINLLTVNGKLQNNGYSSTFLLDRDMRTMFNFQKRLFPNDPQKINEINDAQQYYEQIVSAFKLENKQLIPASKAPASPDEQQQTMPQVPGRTTTMPIQGKSA